MKAASSMLLIATAVLLALSASTVSADRSRLRANFVAPLLKAPDFPSVAEAARGAKLNILLKAVEKSGLAPIFTDTKLKATVFAPTDQAFRRAVKDLDLTLEELLADQKTLSDILKYHVVPDIAAKAKDLKDGQKLNTSLTDERLTVDLKSEEGTVLIRADKSDAAVVKADITAAQSVVHIIDEVLVPSLPSKRKHAARG